MTLHQKLMTQFHELISKPDFNVLGITDNVTRDPLAATLAHDMLIELLCNHIEVLEKRIKALEDAPPPAELRRY